MILNLCFSRWTEHRSGVMGRLVVCCFALTESAWTHSVAECEPLASQDSRMLKAGVKGNLFFDFDSPLVGGIGQLHLKPRKENTRGYIWQSTSKKGKMWRSFVLSPVVPFLIGEFPKKNGLLLFSNIYS